MGGTALLRRVLLHSNEPEPDEHSDDYGGTTSEQDDTLTLRIISIFVIMAGALLGGVPPVFLRSMESLEAAGPRLLRAFSGGVMLALALVHIIPEAVEELAELNLTYTALGGVTSVVGVLVLVMLDSLLAAAFAPRGHGGRGGCLHIAGKGDGGHSHRSSHGQQSVREDVSGDATHGHDHHPHDHSHVHPNSHAHAPAGGTAVVLEGATGPSASVSHAHVCLRQHSEQYVAANPAYVEDGGTHGPLSGVRRMVVAYSMEAGCIFHSFLIGISLGVIVSGQNEVVTLMIALTVHQALEALALSSVLALTGFSRLKRLFMVATFALTTPVGIAIGIAISSTYDPESTTAIAVQGVFNGLSGGMLLYIAMVQLIAEEFSRDDLLRRGGLRCGMYSMLMLGAASMCILAIWA